MSKLTGATTKHGALMPGEIRIPEGVRRSKTMRAMLARLADGPVYAAAHEGVHASRAYWQTCRALASRGLAERILDDGGCAYRITLKGLFIQARIEATCESQD